LSASTTGSRFHSAILKSIACRPIGRTSWTIFKPIPVPKGQAPLGRRRYEMLADVVGTEAANALVAHYGGYELYVPRCAAVLQAARDAQINEIFVNETNKGRSSAEVVFHLARRYKLSDKRVWNILKKIPERCEPFSLVEQARE
jgi:hypothetical protein